jgi:hypothetical protein
MPRIITFRLFRFLWVGFHLNDYEEATGHRFGISEMQARARTVHHS